MEKDRKNEGENSESREGKLGRRVVKETTTGKERKRKETERKVAEERAAGMEM